MRVARVLVALPALAVAQEQIPLLDQVKGWFAKASASLSSVLPNAPTAVSIPNPIASGAAKVAQLKVESLTLNNYKELLQPGAATASPGLEEWMIFITGGNKTCLGMCEHSERAWNESVVLVSAVAKNAPHLALLDCEEESVLCHAWAVSPPSMMHVLLPQPRVDQSTPPTAVRYINFNRTTVAPTTLADIHIHQKYTEVEPYEGIWHPFDGFFATSQLSVPVGYAIWGFSKIPSWGFMIFISFISRSFMSRRAVQNANARDARSAQAQAAASGQ